MGTRADFYVGRGLAAEWLGSIAWDGYPDGLPADFEHQRTEAAWREAVERFFVEREDVTRPDQGWPWPWETSHTTDYSYAFDAGCVWFASFGHRWHLFGTPESEEEDGAKNCAFPNMKSRQSVVFGKRSGILIMGSQGVVDVKD